MYNIIVRLMRRYKVHKLKEIFLKMNKFDEIAKRVMNYDETGTEYYIDWNQRKILDIKMMYFVPLDKMEMILNQAGY